MSKFTDAYKEAFKEELKPLIDAGKITLLGTVEDLAEDLANAVFNAAQKGAAKTETPYDDMVLNSAIGILKPKLLDLVDKIDGKEG